ncbi:MAG: MBL fold metallo-hydrolase [Deltaproteobacteria bacterium]|nr:MBL fold metallo-hydrolase [Deltaproteobacteria bacterium]
MGKLPLASGLSSGLEVVTVGTGTCVPRLGRRGPCTLVRGEGAVVAVDLGLGALHGLLRRGVRHADVDALLLTHLHPDHTAELVPFLFAARYDDRPRRRPLLVAGGPGLLSFFRVLSGAYGSWLEPQGYSRDVRELTVGDELVVGGVSVRCGPVRHIPSSLAYRLEAGGASVVVSGDTGPSPELEGFAAGADLLVLEAGAAGREEADGAAQHLLPRQAGEAARRAGVGALVLNHFPFGPACGRRASREAAETFGKDVTVGRDGEVFQLMRRVGEADRTSR